MITGDLILISREDLEMISGRVAEKGDYFLGEIKGSSSGEMAVEFSFKDRGFNDCRGLCETSRGLWIGPRWMEKIETNLRIGDVVDVSDSSRPGFDDPEGGVIRGYAVSGPVFFFAVEFSGKIHEKLHRCKEMIPSGNGFFFKIGEINKNRKGEIMSKIATADAVVTKASSRNNAIVSADGIIGLEEEKKMIKQAVDHNMSVLLIGETGVGKTYLVQQVGKELGKQVVRISLNGEVGTNEILGKWLAKDGSTYWQDGTLIDCMRHGKWAVGDEINAALPEVLMALNPVLDDGRSIVLSEKDGELVVPHPDFRFFATMNPPEGYAGTKDMNSALMDRFGIVMKLGYYKPTTEIQILKYHTRIEDVLGKIVIDVGNAIRNLRKANRVFFPCGTRSLVNWAKLIVIDGNSLETTFKYSILNKCSDEDAKIIYEEITRAIKIKIDWKASGEDNVRRLTDEMATDIAQISEMKRTLQAYAEEIKTRAKTKEAVV
jgi:MoxR-like ATPase